MKKIVMYGSKLCPDTVETQELFLNNGIQYTYVDITDSMENLGKFLRIRDTNPLYSEKRQNGGIGVPLLELNDGEQYVLELTDEILNSLK